MDIFKDAAKKKFSEGDQDQDTLINLDSLVLGHSLKVLSPKIFFKSCFDFKISFVGGPLLGFDMTAADAYMYVSGHYDYFFFNCQFQSLQPVSLWSDPDILMTY